MKFEGTRAVYTGAIGFLMDNGDAHWNVAIRTASIRNGIGRFHIGAGIVADSDPGARVARNTRQRQYVGKMAAGAS